MSRSQKPAASSSILTLTALKEAAWQLLLVSNMIGIEGFLALQFVAMVTNLRTLGVPVAYTSLPGFIAAVMSQAIIGGLSYVGEKYAKSRKGKALLLVIINAVQYLGAILVIYGNVVKLKYYDDLLPSNSSILPQNKTTITTTTTTTTTASSSIFISSSSSSASDFYHENVTRISNNRPGGFLTDEGSDSSFPIPYYAGLVMFGFSLMESGFDSGNCFLKTYVLACSSPEIHSTVLVKSTFMSSFGGLFVTLLGSSTIGETLAAGTNYNVNAVTTTALVSITLILSVITMATSLITGMVCGSSPTYRYQEIRVGAETRTSHERRRLVSESSTLLPGDQRPEDRRLSASVSVKLVHSTIIDSIRGRSHSDVKDDVTTGVRRKPATNSSSRPKSSVIAFLKRNGFRIRLCVATLFACWASYAFNVYSVNFVSVGIFHGDPSAPADSQEYKSFMKGERSGSVGLVLSYVAYLVSGSLQNMLLRRFGWWREVLWGHVVFIAACLSCAYFLQEWLFLIASCLVGFYRVMNFTVPYLLIAKESNDEHKSPQGSKRSSTDSGIALIAIMWPSSFLLAAAIMGPLLSWTGAASTSVYVTAVVAIIAIVFYWQIRKH